MREIGILVAIALPLFMCILVPLLLVSGWWRAAEERARARRFADAKMNARLLRLNF